MLVPYILWGVWQPDGPPLIKCCSIMYCNYFCAGYKCLQLFHELLSHAPSGSIFSTYIINSLHHMSASEVLLDSISVTMVTIQSQREDSKLHEMLLSRIKLTCEVIILLLNKEITNDSTSLQQLLTGHNKTRSSHAITLYMLYHSFITHVIPLLLQAVK